MRKALAAAVLALAIPLVTACDSWERNTFNTLSTSNAVLKQAQTDYETRAIPHNQCAYDIITKGKTAQTVAVEGFLTYEQVKLANGNVQEAESAVISELGQLAPIIVQVKSLSTGVCK